MKEKNNIAYRKTVKIMITAILTLCLLLSLSACGGSKSEEKTTGKVGETLVYEDVAYTVTGVERSNGTEYDKPDSGKVYVIVSLTIENRSNAAVSYNPYDYRIINSQGQIHDSALTIVNSDTALHYGDLAAGGKVSGTIAFEEDENDTALVFCKYNSFNDKEYFRFELY